MTAPAATQAPLLLTVKQASDLLGLSRQTVYQMLYRGAWPVVRVGTAVRIARADIEAWVVEQREDWATGDHWDERVGRRR